MAAHVRVKSEALLREHIEATGLTQTEVAAKAGLSLQRLNQVVTGVGPVIDVEWAVQLERTLGVELGTLFAVEKPELMRHYLQDHPDEIELVTPYLGDEPPTAPAPA